MTRPSKDCLPKPYDPAAIFVGTGRPFRRPSAPAAADRTIPHTARRPKPARFAVASLCVSRVCLKNGLAHKCGIKSKTWVVSVMLAHIVFHSLCEESPRSHCYPCTMGKNAPSDCRNGPARPRQPVDNPDCLKNELCNFFL